MSKFGGLAVDVASTTRMEIILPGEIDPVTDEAGKVGYIEFLAWDSDAGRKFDREQNKEAVRKGFRQPSRAVLRDEAENADVVLEQAKRLVVLAVGWHLVGPDRKVIDVPFSKDNALELFSDAKTAWLRRQSWVYVGNEANFMKRSSLTSTSSPSASSETRGG